MKQIDLPLYKFYLIEGMTQEDLNELALERNNLSEEVYRLNNIIEEYKNANEYHQNIIHELETMKQPNQLHSENVRLRNQLQQKENIIKEVREYTNTDKNCVPKHIKDYINNLLDKEVN